jgi:hypothetical protein
MATSGRLAPRRMSELWGTMLRVERMKRGPQEPRSRTTMGASQAGGMAWVPSRRVSNTCWCARAAGQAGAVGFHPV